MGYANKTEQASSLAQLFVAIRECRYAYALTNFVIIVVSF